MEGPRGPIIAALVGGPLGPPIMGPIIIPGLVMPPQGPPGSMSP